MSMIKRISEERGQAIVFSILAFTVIFAVGAIAVDIGLWLSERRGAQTDADLLALAGAWELIDPAGSVTDVNNAVDAALDANDGELNASLNSPPDVDLQERCVRVDVDHESKSLFFSIFGVLEEPEIGARAKACAGPVSGGNLIPFQIDNDTAPCFTGELPNFAELCPLELGAQGSNPRGMLDLEADDGFCSNDTGAGDIEDLIAFGTDGPCLINTSGVCPGSHQWIDCAATQTGNPQKVLDGTRARLARDGLCDGPDANGWDDFLETVILVAPDPNDPLQNIYSPRDCDPVMDGVQISPRLVTIIVFDEYPSQNNTPYPIIGLAGFYIAGCAGENETVDTVDDLNRYCDDDYEVMDLRSLSELYVSAAPGLGPFPLPVLGHCPGAHQGPHSGPGARPCPTPTPIPTPTPPTPTPTQPPVGAPGHAVVWGNFVNLTVAGGSPGGGSSSTTFGIYLVE